MKPTRFGLPALLLMAILLGWLSIVSIQQSRVRSVAAPALSHRLVMLPNNATQTGILINPNFQIVLQALKQRAGVKELPEPEVTTIHSLAVNQWNQTFVFTITNK